MDKRTSSLIHFAMILISFYGFTVFDNCCLYKEPDLCCVLIAAQVQYFVVEVVVVVVVV